MGRKRFKTTTDPLLCEDAEFLALNENSCANCCKSLPDTDKMDFVTSSLEAGSYAKIKLADAVSVVFEMAKKLNPTILLDDKDTGYLAMCRNCHTIFNELFDSYKKFLKMTNSRSYIRSYIRNCIVWNANEIPMDILPDFNDERQDHDLNLVNVQFEVIKREEEKLASNKDSETCTRNSNVLPDEDASVTKINDLRSSADEQKLPTTIIYTEKFPLIRLNKLSIEEVNSARNWKYFLEASLEHRISEQSNQDEKTCHLCERKLENRKQAKNHMDLAHKKIFKPFSCQWCNERFVHNWFHKHHLEVFHSGIEMQFMCNICDDVYKTLKELNYHKSTNHSENLQPFRCSHCEEGYKEIEELRDHLLDKHSSSKEAKIAGDNRKYIFENPNPFKLGEELVSSEPQQCSICKKGFTGSLARDKHIRYFHEKRTACVFCDKVFSKVVECRRHETEVHDSYQCPKCDKNFPTLSRLDIHMKLVHLTCNSSNCEVCGKSYATFFHLKAHYKWHTKTASPPKFVCHICKKSFTFQNVYNLHMKFTHKKQKRPTYQCQKCRKSYFAISLLYQHNQRIHGIKSSFQCPSCDRTFPTSKSLQVHSRSHLNLQSKLIRSGDGEFDIMACYSEEQSCFFCSICNAQVRRKDHFIRHVQRQHTSTKRLPAHSVNLQSCGTCDKTFESEQKLREHLRVKGHKAWIPKTHLNLNSQTEAYDCDLCGKVIKGKDKFQRHLRTLRHNKAKNQLTKKKITENDISDFENV